MTVKPHRRFIAGAVCPRCAKMDKIVVDMQSQIRECIDCGFTESRPTDGRPTDGRPTQNAPAAELPTRVSRAAARRVETPAEVVTLVGPRTDNSAE
jgi:uncharacterized metal-binding protein (TIGR02443 family)